MNRKVFGALLVLILGIGTVAAASLRENAGAPSEQNQQRENNDGPWRRAFFAGRAIGPGPVALQANEITQDTETVLPIHAHRVRAAVAVHKNGKIAKGQCSVDRTAYRLDAKKDEDGTWRATLKNEDDKGSATLRWNPESGRYEGTLDLGGHTHRLVMRRIRPSTIQTSEEPPE